MDKIEFDVAERINDINNQYKNVVEIKNSLSDNRGAYRKFAEYIKIDDQALFRCCTEFERSLLINCYTLVEQYFKSCVYFLLEKDNHENKYINRLINNKLPDSKYSPNIRLEDLEKQIKEFFEIDFKFILSKKTEALKKYEDLIKSRHAYAHKGIFNFSFDNFKDVILALEYIKYEIAFILDDDVKRIKFQEIFKNLKEFKNIRGSLNSLKNSKKEKKVNARAIAKSEIKKIKDIIIELKEIIDLKSEIEILKDYFLLLNKIDSLNIEQITDEKIIEIFEEYTLLTKNLFD